MSIDRAQLNNGFWLNDCKVLPLGGTITHPDGRVEPLQQKPMEVLVCLARRPGQVVEHATILDEVWGARPAGPENIGHCIHEIRRALHDDAARPAFIRNSHGRGRSCIATVRLPDTPPSADDREQILRPTPSEIMKIRLRRLFRVAGAYAVIAGFTLEIADVVFPVVVENPQPPLSFLVLLAFIGFPVALIAGWLLDRPPEAAVRDGAPGTALPSPRGDLVLLAGLLVLAVVVFVRGRPASPPPPSPSPAVAVARFQFLGEAQQDYLGYALPDALVDALWKSATVKVIHVLDDARTDPIEIGQERNADFVLSGSVREDGGGLTVVAHLKNTADGETRWSESYSQDPDRVFAIVDDLVVAIVSALGVQADLGRVRQSVIEQATTTDQTALRLYRQGRYLWQKRDETSVRGSLELFDAAIAQDPGFARAYSNRAAAFAFLGIYGWEDPDIANAAAEASARRALQLNGGIGEAHAVLGMIRMLAWDWPAAHRAFDRAIAAEPRDALAHHWFSTFLGQVGKLERSLDEAQQLVDLEPASPAAINRLAWGHLGLGNREQARHFFELTQTLGRAPSFFNAHALYLSADDGGREAALARWRQVVRDEGGDDAWLDAYVRALREPATAGEAIGALRGAFADTVEGRLRQLFLGATLADPALALDVMGHMADGSKGHFGIAPWLPEARALRTDPRFAAAATGMSLTGYWRAFGAPTRCDVDAQGRPRCN